MAGFVKLFSSILESTIWRESDNVRLVWITMLALADKRGEVSASIPGLADRARVSIEDCKEAIKILSSPDEYSRTKDNDGKRIEEIEGGWQLLNYSKYRKKLSEDERREYFKNYMREKRSVKSESTKLTNVKQCHTIAEAEAEAEDKIVCNSYSPSYRTKADNKYTSKVNKVDRLSVYSNNFEKFWNAYPNKKGKAAAFKVFEKKKISEKLLNSILEAIQSQKNWEEWTKEAGQYIPHPATWLNQERWLDEKTEREKYSYASNLIEKYGEKK